jgi:hypothetical protein
MANSSAKTSSDVPDPGSGAGGGDWSPASSDDDDVPHDDLAFAAAIASMGEHLESAGIEGDDGNSTENEVDTIPEGSRGPSVATARAEEETEPDIDDATLLRSMLQDSETYLDNVAMANAEEEKHPCK